MNTDSQQVLLRLVSDLKGLVKALAEAPEVSDATFAAADRVLIQLDRLESRITGTCVACQGTGQTGMAPDGKPLVCKSCGGKGRVPEEPEEEQDPTPYEIDTSDPERYRP